MPGGQWRTEPWNQGGIPILWGVERLCPEPWLGSGSGGLQGGSLITPASGQPCGWAPELGQLLEHVYVGSQALAGQRLPQGPRKWGSTWGHSLIPGGGTLLPASSSVCSSGLGLSPPGVGVGRRLSTWRSGRLKGAWWPHGRPGPAGLGGPGPAFSTLGSLSGLSLGREDSRHLESCPRSLAVLRAGLHGRGWGWGWGLARL